MAQAERPGRHRGSLLAELSSFVGQTRERADLKRLLTVSRLVSITGIGGVSKTRTAVRVAAEMQRGLPDGAWLVDLARLADSELVPEVIA